MFFFQTKWDSYHVSPTIKDLDNKVSEADAYLQLMIEQTKVSNILSYGISIKFHGLNYQHQLYLFLQQLEERIISFTDIEEKAKCEAILEHANVSFIN